jgi:ABC-type multidrug transport system permease subunit
MPQAEPAPTAALTLPVLPGLQERGSGMAVPLPTGLASLDVDIPFQGREYRFMTPQGDVRITGHAVAAEAIFGIGQAIVILLLFVGGAYVLYLGSRGRFNWWIGRTGSTWLIAIGLLALLCLPVIGMLAVIGGAMVKMHRFAGHRPGVRSPFVAGK